MNEFDTDPGVAALRQRLMSERSSAERLAMACGMFDTAVDLILAGLPSQVVADDVERRIALLQRLYWTERETPFMTAVIAALRGSVRASSRRSLGVPPGEAP